MRQAFSRKTVVFLASCGFFFFALCPQAHTRALRGTVALVPGLNLLGIPVDPIQVSPFNMVISLLGA